MRKFLRIFKITFQSKLEYRAEIITRVALDLLGLGLAIFLWHAVMIENQSVGEYNFLGIILYFILANIWGSIKGAKVMDHMSENIRKGKLTEYLLKPANVIAHILSREMAKLLFRFLIGLLIFIIPIALSSSLQNGLILNAYTLTWASLFFVFSFTFNFVFYFALGCLAFWVIKTGGIENVVGQTVGILRGAWFPLDLAPIWFQNFLKFLPFQYLAFYPVKILTVKTSAIDNFNGILILTFYIILFCFLSRVMWKKGLRNYSAVGI